MQTINNNIKNHEIKQFYLLYGEEDYLKLQYRDKIVASLVNLDDNMNLSYFEGNTILPQTIFDLAQTLPFFSEHRVIVIENSGFFKKSIEKIDDHFAMIPKSTYVIFLEKEVDKRNRLYKWIGKNGYCSEMNVPDERMLFAWIRNLCKSNDKEIEDSVIFYLIEHIGTDMFMLKNELDKLFSYCERKKWIDMKDVRTICVNQATDKMFEMLDAIGNHNQDKALLLYHDLLVLKESAMRILYMLTRHYHILMQVAQLVKEGKNQKEIATACGIPPFSVKKYMGQVKKYKIKDLCMMLDECQDTDYSIKTGSIQDVVGVELLIVSFSSSLH